MSAVISECGRYRYTLERGLRYTRVIGSVLFIGVNPSTADASVNDATVRKWMGFGARWSFANMLVGNVFAYRTTDVRVLATADDPVGPDNDHHLAQLIARADVLVPCWGNVDKVPRNLRHRFGHVSQMLHDSDRPVRIFGLTKNGSPLHPLMLGYETELTRWAA